MEITLGKLLAISLAGIYLVVTPLVSDDAADKTISLCMILAWPIAFILFPEAIGGYTGFVRGGYIDQKTPPVLVSAIGWLCLLGTPVFLFWLGTW